MTGPQDNKKIIISGLMWRSLERTCAQGVQFLVSIILARLLSTTEYGYVGIITALIAIGNVFVQAGFGNALIQKKEADEADFSSVFYVSVGIGIGLFLLMQFVSPLIASFYNAPELANPIRVLSFMLIMAGVNTVQQAYVSRKMIFRKYFYATMAGTISSAVVGICMAYKGFGVWALVAQQLVSQLGNTVVLWVTVKWRPKLVFSVTKIKELFRFGWKLLVSGLIDTVYNNMYTFVIGKAYSPDMVGYYNRGKNIPNMVITNINTSIQSVLFPALAKEQSSPERIKSYVRRSVKISTFLIFPCMAGLAAVAESLTVILLTQKWLPSVPFLQMCCFIYAFWPVHTANLQAISAMGRSDIYLRLEVIKKSIGVFALIVTIPMGIYPMMIGRCICAVISAYLNIAPNKKLLHYSLAEQLQDLLPALILSIVMFIAVLLIRYLGLGPWLTLLIQVILGVGIYAGGAYLFKLESMIYVKGMLGKYLKRK